jgi:hypothetical protein
LFCAFQAALQQQVASLQDEKEGLRTHLARVQVHLLVVQVTLAPDVTDALLLPTMHS